MQFNVSSLLQEHTGATRAYDIDDDVRIDGETHHVTGGVRLDRTPRGVLLRAGLQGEMASECSRCLRALTIPMHLEIAEEFIPAIDIVTGARVELSETEQDAYRITPRHVLDLTDSVRQYWAMSSPMAPVCAEDCPGICAECGERLEAPHAGHDGPRDGRWSKLADLKL